MYCRAIV